MDKMPKETRIRLEEDIDLLKRMDKESALNWTEGSQERRLTFEELGKLFRAGNEDIEIILSPNTKTYWIYSNTLGAYCDMDYEGWIQTEEFIKQLVERREYLFPTMVWAFGDLDL